MANADYTVEWTTSTSASGDDFYVWYPSREAVQAVDDYVITTCPSVWTVSNNVSEEYWENMIAQWEEYKELMAKALNVPPKLLWGSNKNSDPRVEILITFENNNP